MNRDKRIYSHIRQKALKSKKRRRDFSFSSYAYRKSMSDTFRILFTERTCLDCGYCSYDDEKLWCSRQTTWDDVPFGYVCHSWYKGDIDMASTSYDDVMNSERGVM